MNAVDQLQRIRERIEDSTGEALALIDRSIAALSDAQSHDGTAPPKSATRPARSRTAPEDSISDNAHNWEE